MAPSSTSLRRICTMMGTCSTATGQISTQAMQVRQDHSVSIATCPGALPCTSSSAAAGSTPDSSVAFANSRKLKITSRGDNGAPTARAGQASWQRPHFVQASRFSSCFQVKSVILATPGAFWLSGMRGSRCAARPSRTINEAAAVKMCLTLV